MRFRRWAHHSCKALAVPNLPLHMNWVLVDDKKGNPRAQMRWVVEG